MSVCQNVYVSISACRARPRLIAMIQQEPGQHEQMCRPVFGRILLGIGRVDLQDRGHSRPGSGRIAAYSTNDSGIWSPRLNLYHDLCTTRPTPTPNLLLSPYPKTIQANPTTIPTTAIRATPPPPSPLLCPPLPATFSLVTHFALRPCPVQISFSSSHVHTPAA
jgi:hypothetical protein